VGPPSGTIGLIRHCLGMNAGPQHPFSVRTVPCRERLGHFRWEVHEQGRLRETSPDSYPTEPMAASYAEAVMEQLVSRWRTGS
jgi:hypothetical protein